MACESLALRETGGGRSVATISECLLFSIEGGASNVERLLRSGDDNAPTSQEEPDSVVGRRRGNPGFLLSRVEEEAVGAGAGGLIGLTSLRASFSVFLSLASAFRRVTIDGT